MKRIAITLRAVILFTVPFISGCDSSEPQPETERVKELLTATEWKMQTVTVDGADQTSVYAGLRLSFTSSSYTATNGGAIWPASGTWSFADESGKMINRNDGLQLTVDEVTAIKLALKLSWSKTTLGRVESVSGAHVFVFNK